MHIYLKHFIHGTKVAISEQEAVYDESHGWVRYTPDAIIPEKSDVVAMNALAIKRGKIAKEGT